MEENRKKQTRPYPKQIILTIRVIVGGYLDYLAYQIITSGEEKGPFMYCAVVAFIISGTFLAGWSLLSLILGKYEGGKADHWEEDHPEIVEEAVKSAEVETENTADPEDVVEKV